MPYPPAEALGAELVYFREDGRRHTLVTIAGALFANVVGVPRVTVTLALHDVTGRFVGAIERPLSADGTLFVDSRELASVIAGAPSEGALVAWITPPPGTPDDARKRYWRAFAMVDWLSDDGELASLHTDQSVRADLEGPIDFTEIVFVETEANRTALVLVNGPERQPPAPLELVLRNRGGIERRVVYEPAMEPFSVHTVRLRELVPDLVAFCGGVEATIAGRFTARRVFTRPYVMTEGGVFSAYHGGDRYRMSSIPGMAHRTFPYADASAGVPWEMMRVAAQREMNPAYAVHRPGLTTRIHLFQSHGDVDADFAVDVALHDLAGRIIACREAFAIAPRLGTTTCDLGELTGGAPFEGHVALRFTDERRAAFPQRLQALVEYRTPVSVARTMLWSDRWNAPDRLRSQRRTQALYRVFSGGRRESSLAITNAGVGLDYDREAPYTVTLSTTGGELVHRGVLAAHATKVASIAELFPGCVPDELAVATVASDFDLASMHLTRDGQSGVVAAEHLMAVMERVGDVVVTPCGA